MKTRDSRSPSGLPTSGLPTSDLRPPSSGVCVIIVNFNSSAYARRCVESVMEEFRLTTFAKATVVKKAETTKAEGTKAEGTEIIVIDNASSDDPVGALKDLPNTRLVLNKENVGFGAAVNQAARMTDAGLLWLLNPDCEVVPGALAALRETLNRHPDCAIAAPRLLNADGSIQASARGEPNALTGLFGRHTVLTKWFPDATAARHNLRADELVASGAESAEVDWVMGASMLIRREAFDLVRGFDERYFLYWEDADLCRRLRDVGLSTRYVSRAIVRHAGGVSASSWTRLATRAFHESAYQYYATHVVPQPWHPARPLAWIALRCRAWWRSRGPRN